MKILAIDPGNIESAYVLMDNEYKPIEIGKVENEELLTKLKVLAGSYFIDTVVIEMVASYGMTVGKDIFETVFWIGRFYEIASKYLEVHRMFRKDVKMNLCHTMKAKDSNITQALVDRFTPGEKNYGKGTKKQPGWFYGFKKDIWASYGVGVTYLDKLKGIYI